MDDNSHCNCDQALAYLALVKRLVALANPETEDDRELLQSAGELVGVWESEHERSL